MRHASLTACLLLLLACSQLAKAQTSATYPALTDAQRQGVGRSIALFDRMDLAMKFNKKSECINLWDDNRKWLIALADQLPHGVLLNEYTKTALGYSDLIDLWIEVDDRDPDLDKIEKLIKRYEMQYLEPREMFERDVRSSLQSGVHSKKGHR